MLTREDANSDSALLAGWLVDDRAQVRRGQPVCLVETSKASIEVEAPADGFLVHLVEAGSEVELGRAVALLAGEGELEAASASRARRAAPAPRGRRRVTRRAAELAERHGIDLDELARPGFVTADDVEALIRTRSGGDSGGGDTLFAGLSTENVSLPAEVGLDAGEGVLDPAFLDSLRADPETFAALAAAEKVELYRRHGARVGDGVAIGAGAAVVAPRIVLGDRVVLADGVRVACEEVFAAGELALLGRSFSLTCRRAFVGAGTWTGERIVVGGGGSRDPWATFVLGELGFVGDEAFVNVCRPVLLGREVFLTMRSVLLTHNVGHSVLEGFENRFAGIVVEDRAQVGVGTVVYAGCRIGREAIVGSNSYVVADVPAGSLAVGVPARRAGAARRPLARRQQAELARRLVAELRQLLELRGIAVEPLEPGLEGFAVAQAEGRGSVLFAERLAPDTPRPAAAAGETVVLALGLAGPPPAGCAVLDLLGRRVHGDGGVLLDSVREFCRKRGIRFEPGPWRYGGGLG